MSAPVVLAAGGTGGHLFPAQALAGELAARGHDLALVTDRRGAAFGEALGGGVAIYRVRAGAVAGRGVLGRLLGLADVAWGVLQARRLLRRINPFSTTPRVPDIVSVLARTVSLANEHVAAAQKARADLLIRPPVEQFSLFDTESFYDLYRVGYEHAREEVAAWLKSGGLDS